MNTGEKKKIYERWQKSLDRARIPAWARKNTPASILPFIRAEESKKRKLVGIIYQDLDKWVNGSTFIIDGSLACQGKSPADVRRAVGLAILQSGVTYACQSSKFCPPYGRYIDYKTIVNSFMNKEKASALADDLSVTELLFISEIYMSAKANEVLKDIVAFKMDDMLRRRVDSGLVTIMSFSRPCIEFMEGNVLGDEIDQLLQVSGANGTSHIGTADIFRICTG